MPLYAGNDTPEEWTIVIKMYNVRVISRLRKALKMRPKQGGMVFYKFRAEGA